MIDLRIGDVKEQLRLMEPQSVHCAVSSPPYWALRSYLPSDHPRKQLELGSEPTIDAFVENLCSVYDEVWRVLRDDGLCFVNLGDSYAATTYSNRHGKSSSTMTTGAATVPDEYRITTSKKEIDIPPGNQCMVPERFALAMQARGWVLRSKIVWAKAISVDAKMGSCMPESLGSTRWERCRVKVAPSTRSDASRYEGAAYSSPMRAPGGPKNNLGDAPGALFQPCPGCPRCESTGGLVLRRGSWRPTNSWEAIYMFSKGMAYYADGEAVKEAASEKTQFTPDSQSPGHAICHDTNRLPTTFELYRPPFSNIRSVWHIGTEAFPGSHFATYPQKLPELCIKVGTSERGVCPSCGAPWARIIESQQLKRDRPNDYTKRTGEAGTGNSCGNTVAGVESRTVGWKPTCGCGVGDTVPGIVLDPFAGSGTTLIVAEKLRRDSIGIDIDERAESHLADRQAAERRRDAERFGIKRQKESIEGQRTLFG